jgi:hypothetical protein
MRWPFIINDASFHQHRKTGIMMKLIGMMDSPYVRRVAISLELYGVEFESHPLSVFSSFDAFSRINPAVKAPTLVLDNGIRLMDSSLILAYFEGQAAPARKLLPADPLALASDLQTLGFILAAGEKAVQNVYEHKLRPAEKQHNPWITHHDSAAGGLQGVEYPAGGASGGRGPDQVAVTSTVIWTFIQSTIPHVVHAGDFNHIQSVAELLKPMRLLKTSLWLKHQLNKMKLKPNVNLHDANSARQPRARYPDGRNPSA